MKIAMDQRGVALITALMLTLICLTIVMTLFYMIGRNIEVSASHKRYKTALEAAYGSVEVSFDGVVPRLFEGRSLTEINDDLGDLNLTFGSGSACLNAKLSGDASTWPSTCDNTLDAKTGYDIGFTLNAANASTGAYQVYSKIVDTRPGNTDMSGRVLEGVGVVENQQLAPPHRPYMYRVEIRAESTGATRERAELSAVYGY